ncbi:MAG: hypothetical protein C0603_04010 [Denitrovibrio sp.]|nr:MAG: hypothetical protein C0603_04010 [Denitrovibrio sp.]
MKLKILILSLFLISSAFAGDITDEIVKSDRNLSKVKTLIDKETKAVDQLTDEKKKTARQLRKAEIELSYQKKIAKKLERKLLQSKKEISYINFKQQKLSTREGELISSIKSANSYLAGAGETDLLEALILADEATELTAGLQIISRVNAKLFDMVEELASIRSDLDISKANYTKKKSEIEKSLNEKKAAVKQYQSKKTLVKQLYKMATEDEKIQKEYVGMLASKQRELENKIKSLEIKNIKQGELKKFDGINKRFGQHKTLLEWPLRGTVIEKFGTKKVKGFKGVVHKKGIKIQPTETQVSSIYDGVVMHTDTAWGLGWFVIVEHFGGYYSLYANLDEIIVNMNQKVHSGEILGTIDIDRDENTPYLYFEIRIHDKAVDPLKWLSS